MGAGGAHRKSDFANKCTEAITKAPHRRQIVSRDSKPAKMKLDVEKTMHAKITCVSGARVSLLARSSDLSFADHNIVCRHRYIRS